MFAQAPRFWSVPGSLAGALLSPLGALIGAVPVHRMGQPGEAIGLPVICIGNPTVGGTGKTPTAIALLNALTTGHTDDVAGLINGTKERMVDKAVVFELINQKPQRGAANR